MHAFQGTVVGIALAAACSAARAEGEGPKGLEAFTRHDRVLDVRLSPGGTRLATITLEGGRPGLAVIDLEGRKLANFFKPEGTTGVLDVHWASDDRLVLGLADYEGDLAAPKDRGELYSLPAEGRGGRMIFGYRAGEKQVGSHIKKAEGERAWGWFLGRVRGDDRHVLVGPRTR